MTKTILLADDSLTIQKVVELTFADTPFTVVSVSSGDELLDRIGEVQPDLIICDIIMPGRDGYNVCQDVKSSPDTLHIPVILLSGTFEPLDRDRALAVGCSEILAKPFEARKLIETVERLLQRGETAAVPVRAGASGGTVTGRSSVASDFGTRLSAEPEGVGDAEPAVDELSEGLDFTETGFTDMEAAAARPSDAALELPTEGLDFEVGGDEIDPFADLDAAGADRPGGTDAADAFELGGEPFTAAEEDAEDLFGDGSVFDEPGEPVAGAQGRPEAERSDADTGPAFGIPTGGDVEAAAEPLLDVGPAELDAAPEPRPDLDFSAGAGFTSDADTAPLPPIEGAAADATTAPPPPPAAITGLSDEDVDRIARRLLELADDRIEQIVWEVIPDVAEVVVRERIRKLEAELETDS